MSNHDTRALLPEVEIFAAILERATALAKPTRARSLPFRLSPKRNGAASKASGRGPSKRKVKK